MLGIIITEETHTFLSIWKLRAKVNSVKFSSNPLKLCFFYYKRGKILTQQEVKLPVPVENNGC